MTTARTSPKPVVVMCSGLKDDDLERVQILAAIGKCELAAAHTPHVTHLVVKAKPGSTPPVALKRTMKYILAVVNKVVIVRAECTG